MTFGLDFADVETFRLRHLIPLHYGLQLNGSFLGLTLALGPCAAPCSSVPRSRKSDRKTSKELMEESGRTRRNMQCMPLAEIFRDLPKFSA